MIALLVFAILAVHASSSVAAQPQVGCTSSTCPLTISRSIITNDWGVTVMNDTVKLNATSPATYLSVGLPAAVASRLRYVSATDAQGSVLEVSQQPMNLTGNYEPIQVSLPAVKQNGYSFTMSSIFTGLLRLNASSSTSQFVLSFSPFPVVDRTLNVTQASFTLKTNDWPSPTVTGVHGTLSGGSFTTRPVPLNAYNATVAMMSFSSTGTSQKLFEASAARTIAISSSGAVQVTDSYNVTNRGPQVPSLTFVLPNGASSVTGSDLIGQLDPGKVTVTLTNGTATVSFTPRFNSISTNASALLLLRYRLLTGATASQGMPGRYALAFRMFDNVKFFQPVFQTKITLPTGFRVSDLTGQVPTVSGSQILLQASSVSPLSKLSFTLTYQLDPFWAGLAPLSWAGLVEGALAASVLVYNVGVRGAVSGVAPSSLIGRFVDLYDEKSAMRSESDKMEEDSNRGALNRSDYKRRKRSMDLRLSEIDRSLVSVKAELASEHSRYSDLVRRVERSEAELQVTRSSLNDLRNQYRLGRISRELYESLTSDLLRRRGKAQAAIDSVIIGLREETR